jgi:hypothetical protein
MGFLLPNTLFGAAATTLLVLFAAKCLAQDGECKCNGCTNSSTALLVTSEDIISPVCEEGSVAALVLLRSIDDTGDYEVITWYVSNQKKKLDVFLTIVYCICFHKMPRLV